FIQKKQVEWMNETGSHIVWDALLGDSPDPAEVMRLMRDGTLPIRISAVDVGTSIAVSSGSFLTFKVETTRQRIPGATSANVSDPAAHWNAIVDSDLIAPDAPFVRSLLAT